MQVRRFHLPAIPAVGEVVALPDEEARHAATVLRLRVGEPLILLDGAGTLAEAEVAELTGGRRPDVICRIVKREILSPPALRIRLYVAPPRGKTAGLVLRTATELGVWRITPILCEYGVARPEGDKASWRAELVAACKQSGNAFVPELDTPASFADALAQAVEPGAFGAVPRSASPDAKGLPADGELGLWIGPEGGFSAAEEEALHGRGFVPVTVGRWILRVETAVPALLGYLAARGVGI
jgi:16S rRNA (uracil1498-N3)-methyltransferase